MIQKLICNWVNCEEEGTEILHKRHGISVYCIKHFQIIIKRRLKIKENKGEWEQTDFKKNG